MNMKILICKGGSDICEKVCSVMKESGECYVCEDGEDALFRASSNVYDLVVADIKLPKMNCIEFITQLRKRSNVPLAVFSDMDNGELAADVLELGADEYLHGPVNEREIKARVDAVLRRANNLFMSNVYELGNIKLDVKTKMFTVDGKYVKLSGKMYDIMEYFIRNRNIVVNKEQLYSYVWGEDCNTVLSVTEVYVSNLRKILKNYNADKYLQTIKNVGYIWNENA